ncbi:Transposon Ty3-I Gag-Pol polyprotein [Sesbania bispinosa]|nr:Transposon Ty3-I Gag-Pol polyprotein [Sesbania bispinosa]
MENYLCRNNEIPPKPVFKFVHWDITWAKDLGGYPKGEVLMFKKDAKSIFSKDNATLCSSLGEVLGLSLNIEIPVTVVYEPGSGIVSMKPLPVCPFQRHVQ